MTIEYLTQYRMRSQLVNSDCVIKKKEYINTYYENPHLKGVFNMFINSFTVLTETLFLHFITTATTTEHSSLNRPL